MISRVARALYQRNPFLEAVPWLMLASALRFYAYSAGGVASLVSSALSNLAIFLALLLAARRMIEWTGGSVRFGSSTLRDQLRLGQQILNRVLLLVGGMAVLVALLGYKSLAPYVLLGFDGIAFDQFRYAGMAWSACLAALVYLMLIDAEQHGAPSLPRAMRAFLSAWRWLVPAIVLVALSHIAISVVQSQLRAVIAAMWTSGSMPLPAMKAIYFTFVFGFATLRLWVTLAILTYAIREACRSGPQSGPPSRIN